MLTAVCLGSEDVTLQILQQIYIPFLAYGMNGAGHLSIPFEACTVSQLVQEHLWHIWKNRMKASFCQRSRTTFAQRMLSLSSS